MRELLLPPDVLAEGKQEQESSEKPRKRGGGPSKKGGLGLEDD